MGPKKKIRSASPQLQNVTNITSASEGQGYLFASVFKGLLRGGGKMRIFGRSKTKDVCRSAAKICFTSSICYKVSPYQFLAKSDNFR